MYEASSQSATEQPRDTSQIEQDRRALDHTLDRIYEMLCNLGDRLTPLLPTIPPEPATNKPSDGLVAAEPVRCELAEKLRAMNGTARRCEASISTLLNNLQV